jgi:hypothetical protein
MPKYIICSNCATTLKIIDDKVDWLNSEEISLTCPNKDCQTLFEGGDNWLGIENVWLKMIHLPEASRNGGDLTPSEE